MNPVIIETSPMPGMEHPVCLTNATCENAHGTPELLAEYGLPGGSFEGEFYPLTDAESKFIGDDLVEVFDGFEAMTGYSVLYEGRKFLAPTVEFYYGDGVSTTEQEARDACDTSVRCLAEHVGDFGGRVLVHEDMDDRINMMVMIPFEYARDNAKDFEGWKQHLEEEVFAKAFAPSGMTP
jgi:hypothetical protein